MINGSFKTKTLLLQGDTVAGDIQLNATNNEFKMKMGVEDLMTAYRESGSNSALLKMKTPTQFDSTVQIGNVVNVQDSIYNIEKKANWHELEVDGDKDNELMPYKVYLPNDYQHLQNTGWMVGIMESYGMIGWPWNGKLPEHHKYPLLMMLHNADISTGNPFGSQTEGRKAFDVLNRTGPFRAISENLLPEQQFIYVALHDNNGNFEVDEVRATLSKVLDLYPIDPTKVYLGGISYGVQGVYEYLEKYRDNPIVAAAVCASPDVDPVTVTTDFIQRINVPIWNFIAENDTQAYNPNTNLSELMNLPERSVVRTGDGSDSTENSRMIQNTVFIGDAGYPYFAHYGGTLDVWNSVFVGNGDNIKSGPYDIDLYTWLLKHNRSDGDLNSMKSEILTTKLEAQALNRTVVTENDINVIKTSVEGNAVVAPLLQQRNNQLTEVSDAEAALDQAVLAAQAAKILSDESPSDTTLAVTLLQKTNDIVAKKIILIAAETQLTVQDEYTETDTPLTGNYALYDNVSEELVVEQLKVAFTVQSEKETLYKQALSAETNSVHPKVSVETALETARGETETAYAASVETVSDTTAEALLNKLNEESIALQNVLNIEEAEVRRSTTGYSLAATIATATSARADANLHFDDASKETAAVLAESAANIEQALEDHAQLSVTKENASIAWKASIDYRLTLPTPVREYNSGEPVAPV